MERSRLCHISIKLFLNGVLVALAVALLSYPCRTLVENTSWSLTTAEATMPPLPREIFNHRTYRSVLRLWYSGQPLDHTAPTPTVLNRWFSGGTQEEKLAFDAKCRSECSAALEFLSPEKYRLPAWRSFDDDRRNALFLSEGLRARIAEDGLSESSPDGSPLEGDCVPRKLDRADIARFFVVLLDQMSRNIFREIHEQWRIYSHYDRLSRALLHSIFETGGVEQDGRAELTNLDVNDGLSHSPAHMMAWYMPLDHSEDLSDHNVMDEKIASLLTRCELQDDVAGKDFVHTFEGFERQHREILEQFGRYPHRNEALGRQSTKEEEEYLKSGGQRFGTG